MCDSGASTVSGQKAKFRGVNYHYNVSTNGRQINGSTRRNLGRRASEVGKFIFLMDFVVIGIEEDKQIPLFVGRPFLAIGATMIHVKKGELTLKVGIEEVHFNINKSLKQHDVEQAKCMKIDSVILVCKVKNDDLINKNSFDDYISSSLYNDDLKKE